MIYPHPKGWSIMATWKAGNFLEILTSEAAIHPSRKQRSISTWLRKEAVISSTARDLITKG